MLLFAVPDVCITSRIVLCCVACIALNRNLKPWHISFLIPLEFCVIFHAKRKDKTRPFI